MNPLNQDSLVGKVVLGVIRHSITTFAGGFVAKGLITHDQQQTLVAGFMVAVGLAMSIYDKAQKGKADE